LPPKTPFNPGNFTPTNTFESGVTGVTLVSPSENSSSNAGFTPNKKASKLKGFLSALYFKCEDYIDNTDKYDSVEFYNSIQNGFLKYQEALKEE